MAGVQLRRARTRTGVVLAITCLLLLSACGGGDDSSSGQSQGASGDTGATITMWTRVATQDASKRLVERYNATHKNKVELTPIPTDNYQARVAAAAGGALVCSHGELFGTVLERLVGRARQRRPAGLAAGFRVGAGRRRRLGPAQRLPIAAPFVGPLRWNSGLQLSDGVVIG